MGLYKEDEISCGQDTEPQIYFCLECSLGDPSLGLSTPAAVWGSCLSLQLSVKVTHVKVTHVKHLHNQTVLYKYRLLAAAEYGCDENEVKTGMLATFQEGHLTYLCRSIELSL